MVKELKDLKGCLCEQEELTEVWLSRDRDGYTDLQAQKDNQGLRLIAWGEGMADYRPAYCPFCGKQIRDGDLLKKVMTDGAEFADAPTMNPAT